MKVMAQYSCEFYANQLLNCEQCTQTPAFDYLSYERSRLFDPVSVSEKMQTVKKERRTAAGRQTRGNARAWCDASLIGPPWKRAYYRTYFTLGWLWCCCCCCWKSREHLSRLHSQTSVGSQQKCPWWSYYRVIFGTSVILHRKSRDVEKKKKDVFFFPRGRW